MRQSSSSKVNLPNSQTSSQPNTILQSATIRSTKSSKVSSSTLTQGTVSQSQRLDSASIVGQIITSSRNASASTSPGALDSSSSLVSTSSKVVGPSSSVVGTTLSKAGTSSRKASSTIATTRISSVSTLTSSGMASSSAVVATKSSIAAVTSSVGPGPVSPGLSFLPTTRTNTSPSETKASSKNQRVSAAEITGTAPSSASQTQLKTEATQASPAASHKSQLKEDTESPNRKPPTSFISLTTMPSSRSQTESMSPFIYTSSVSPIPTSNKQSPNSMSNVPSTNSAAGSTESQKPGDFDEDGQSVNGGQNNNGGQDSKGSQSNSSGSSGSTQSQELDSGRQSSNQNGGGISGGSDTVNQGGQDGGDGASGSSEPQYSGGIAEAFQNSHSGSSSSGKLQDMPQRPDKQSNGGASTDLEDSNEGVQNNSSDSPGFGKNQNAAQQSDNQNNDGNTGKQGGLSSHSSPIIENLAESNSVDNGGGIQIASNSPKLIPTKVNSVSLSQVNGAPPVTTDNFNFNDGTVSSNGSPIIPQNARAINAALPASIQSSFNLNDINYYDPGLGDYYYAKVCSKTGCAIAQIARACNCFTSAVDHQTHYISTEPSSLLDLLIPSKDQVIPESLGYSVQSGDSLAEIAKRFDIPLELLEAANPQIKDANVIVPGQTIKVPAQAYTVHRGDTLSVIAGRVSTTLAAILQLNRQIKNPYDIIPGQLVKVPAIRPNTPFTYTIKAGDSLSDLADRYGINLITLEAANPQISNKDRIFPTDIIRIPSYLPFQGKVVYNDDCPTCSGDSTSSESIEDENEMEKLWKRTTFGPSPKFRLLNKAAI